MKYKTYLALILIVGLFSFTACSGGDDYIPPDPDEDEIEDWEGDDEIGAGIDEGFTIDYFSDNGMYVIYPDGSAEPASYGDGLSLGSERDQETNIRYDHFAGGYKEVSRSKDTLACIDSNGDGVSEKLIRLESLIGYADVHNNDTWYNDTTYLPMGFMEINGIDISSCTTYDQMNSLLRSAGITAFADGVETYLVTDEPMTVDIKYHEGTVVDHIFVDAHTPVFKTVDYKEDLEETEITVPMKLTDDGYSIVDISSLPNGYYCYYHSQDIYTNCIIHIVD